MVLHRYSMFSSLFSIYFSKRLEKDSDDAGVYRCSYMELKENRALEHPTARVTKVLLELKDLATRFFSTTDGISGEVVLVDDRVRTPLRMSRRSTSIDCITPIAAGPCHIASGFTN